MNFVEYIERLEKIDNLIRMENTGTAEELAESFNVSERQIYRIIAIMKKFGTEIEYSRVKRSYVYKKSVEFRFGFFRLDSN